MKKKLLFWVLAAAVAGALLWIWPRYALVGIVCLAAGWIGRAVCAKRSGR